MNYTGNHGVSVLPSSIPGSEQSQNLLPIACRFVPSDQWLVSHVDTSWNISQVKQWLLRKCNAWGQSPPDAPRFRPASPVTFASSSRRNSAEELIGDDEIEDEILYEGSNDDFRFDYNKDVRNANTSMDKDKAGSSSLDQAVRRASSMDFWELGSGEGKTDDSDLPSRYVLLSFSNGHILEDKNPLRLYSLRPHELLELHRSKNIVSLPRHSLAYIEPYFDAPVRMLSVTESGGIPDWDNAKKFRSGRLRHPDERDHEWKARWVFLRQGIMHICKSSMGLPIDKFPIRNLVALRGSKHFDSLVSHPWCICLKFHPNPWISSQNQDDPSRNPRYNAKWLEANSDHIAAWVVLKLPDENSHQNIVRIIHRIAPQDLTTTPHPPSSNTPRASCSSQVSPTTTTASTSFPSSASLTSSTSSRSTRSSITVTTATHTSSSNGTAEPSDSLPIGGGVEYPKWRIKLLERARKAGLGDVSPAMAHKLYGIELEPREVVQSSNMRTRSTTLTVHTKPRITTEDEANASSGSDDENSSASPQHQDETSWKDSTNSAYDDQIKINYMDDSDSDADIDSEVEWEGWARDLRRRDSSSRQSNWGPIPTLSASASTTASSPSSPASVETSLSDNNLSQQRAQSRYAPLAFQSYIPSSDLEAGISNRYRYAFARDDEDIPINSGFVTQTLISAGGTVRSRSKTFTASPSSVSPQASPPSPTSFNFHHNSSSRRHLGGSSSSSSHHSSAHNSPIVLGTLSAAFGSSSQSSSSKRRTPATLVMASSPPPMVSYQISSPRSPEHRNEDSLPSGSKGGKGGKSKKDRDGPQSPGTKKHSSRTKSHVTDRRDG